jgi:beta-RFAP synthase
MMVALPGYVMTAAHADRDHCDGADEAACMRVLEFIRRIRESSGDVPPIQVMLSASIPSHAGLGSGTQLALAVARAISELNGETGIDSATLARRVGRGQRSAIGLHGFDRGGFLVDGGRVGSGQLGTLVSRIEFPSRWRLILVTASQTKGLCGVEELKAFASQPPMLSSLTSELCRTALMEWMPGLIEADFERASTAMYEFGLNVGKFFAPVQGGVFADPKIGDLANEVRRRGFAGVAQTSWGPTSCILCDSEASAKQLVNDLSSDSKWNGCSFAMTEPLNRGALVEVAD